MHWRSLKCLSNALYYFHDLGYKKNWVLLNDCHIDIRSKHGQDYVLRIWQQGIDGSHDDTVSLHDAGHQQGSHTSVLAKIVKGQSKKSDSVCGTS